LEQLGSRQTNHHRITRVGLCPLNSTPWFHVRLSRDDRSFMAVTNFDYETFDYLHVQFQSKFEELISRPNLAHKRRILSSYDVLGLVMCYLKNGASQVFLQMTFGLTQSSLSRYINLGLDVLEESVKFIDECKVVFPSLERQAMWARRFHHRFPLCTPHVVAFMNGVGFPIQHDYKNALLQEYNYSGYDGIDCVKCIFIWNGWYSNRLL